MLKEKKSGNLFISGKLFCIYYKVSKFSVFSFLHLVQDDVRHRTRISSSTLCTGSSLSLSSGPTSGYNSGQTTQLLHCSGSPPAAQVCLNTTGEKKRFSSFPWFCFNRPTESLLPLFRSQGSKTRRTGWGGVLEDGSPSMVRTSRSSLFLSSQKHPHTSFVRHVSSDIRLESPTSGFEPLMTSSPSFTTTGRRQRAASLGSSSSISTSYQDITSPLLSRVVAEVTFIHSFVQFILYVRSLLKSLS